MALKNTMWVAVLLGTVMIFIVIATSTINERIETLEGKVEVLENQTSGLEQGQADLCRTVLRLSEINNALVTLAGSSDVFRIEEAYNKILASQAYCRNVVAVYIDVRQAEDLKIRFVGTEITSYMRGSWWEGLDPTISLLDAEGEVLVTLDPLPYFRRGDFMRVWISDEEPSWAGFYDQTTGLAVSIEHLDGSFEPSISR